jgi:hypothetical protein
VACPTPTRRQRATAEPRARQPWRALRVVGRSLCLDRLIDELISVSRLYIRFYRSEFRLDKVIFSTMMTELANASVPNVPPRTQTGIRRKTSEQSKKKTMSKKWTAWNSCSNLLWGVILDWSGWEHVRMLYYIPCRVPNINFTFQSIVTFFLEFFQTD